MKDVNRAKYVNKNNYDNFLKLYVPFMHVSKICEA